MAATPIIPEYITVHLGDPNDPNAPNLDISFIDYIKNVASSEIYPTWPENALRANIYAQVTFALNRIFTEWYPSQGYDFDITSSTRYDQKFVPDREIYQTVSEIVDSLFNDYIVRQGSIQPLYAQYCNGTTSTCEGLSQWGTVELANEGLTPYEILQYYYGNDINLVTDAPIEANLPSYPGYPLRLGDAGNDVIILKRQLNRIGVNYPAVRPKLVISEFFNIEMEQAVQSFQRIFNLTQDGIVGEATWYKIKSIYNAVKRLAELQSEGLTLEDVSRIYLDALGPGSSGPQVKLVQYYLSWVAYFNDAIPVPDLSGVYDAATIASVEAFQAQQGLPVDGIVGRLTWSALQRAYDQTVQSIPPEVLASTDEIYPGRFLSLGQSGEEVTTLQEFLAAAAAKNDAIPAVTVTGTYDVQTESAVRAVQAIAGLPENGVTGPLTWDAAVQLSK
jgi:peptidoglycan hydrolase-like protein with peptidoglycan-binding domain